MKAGMNHWLLGSDLLVFTLVLLTSSGAEARTRVPANVASLVDYNECITMMSEVERLKLQNFSREDLLGRPGAELRRLFGDSEFERHLGRLLVGMPAIAAGPVANVQGQVRALWSERQKVALRLEIHEMDDAWADHVRKGFAERERTLRSNLGDREFEKVSTELVSADVPN